MIPYDFLKMTSLNFDRSLHITVGPMFSGKTSSLMYHLTVYSDIGVPIVYINSTDDTRDIHFSTHHSSMKHVSSNIKMKKAKDLFELSQDMDVLNSKIIGIDEAQFFTDLVPFVKELLKQDKVIYVCGLDGDFQQNRIGTILDLIPYSTTVKKLNSICKKCLEMNQTYSMAPYTRRIVNISDQKVIGGSDFYIPVCHSHLYD